MARAYASQGFSREEALHYTVVQRIDEGVLEGFLRQNRAEVISLFLEEWDEEKYRDLLRREAREDGYAAGKDEVRVEFLARAAEQVRSGELTPSDAARIFGFSEEEVSRAVDATRASQ